MLFNTKPWKFIWRENDCFQICINISSCHFHPLFSDDLHHIRNLLQQHTEVPQIKPEMLCSSSADAQGKAHHGGRGMAQAANGLKLPTLLARPGLAQRLKGPLAELGSLWGPLNAVSAAGTSPLSGSPPLCLQPGLSLLDHTEGTILPGHTEPFPGYLIHGSYGRSL